MVIVSVMGDQQEGLRLGAVDYLTKPIDPLRLVSSVNRVLQGPGKVLVVDDDRDTRDLLQAALEQRGFTVVLDLQRQTRLDAGAAGASQFDPARS